MTQPMNKPRAVIFAALCGMLLPWAGSGAQNSAQNSAPSSTPGSGQSSAPVQATWKTQEIRYTYTGFTTAYNCDAAEDRLKAILRALGAHEQTKVSATGCDFNRPSRNFFINITTATPVPAADVPTPSQADTSKEALLKRLGVPDKQLDETFPAEWKTIQLARERRLYLQPGDCELMQGLRDHVLPKLSIKVVADRVRCIPRQVTLQTPELTVSALVRMAKPDEPKPKS